MTEPHETGGGAGPEGEDDELPWSELRQARMTRFEIRAVPGAGRPQPAGGGALVGALRLLRRGQASDRRRLEHR